MEDLWHLTGYLPSKCHPVVAVCVWSGYVQLSIVQKKRLQEMLHIFSLQHKPHLFICCQRMISVAIHHNYTHNANKEWVKLQKKPAHTHTHLLHISPLIFMKYCKHTRRFFSTFLLIFFRQHYTNWSFKAWVYSISQYRMNTANQGVFVGVYSKQAVFI